MMPLGCGQPLEEYCDSIIMPFLSFPFFATLVLQEVVVLVASVAEQPACMIGHRWKTAHWLVHGTKRAGYRSG